MQKQSLYYQKGYGGVEAFLVGVVFAAVLYVFLYPSSFAPSDKYANQNSYFCRPYLDADGTIKPDAPTIMAPSYTGTTNTPELQISQDMKPYRLIKSNVALPEGLVKNAFKKENLHNASPEQVVCGTFGPPTDRHQHFCQWIHEPIKINSPLTKSYQYAVLYPAPYTDQHLDTVGLSSPFDSDLGPGQTIRYADHQVIFLVHLDKDMMQYPPLGKPASRPDGDMFYPVDIYQQVREDDPSIPVKPMPQSVLECKDDSSGTSGLGYTDIIERSTHKAEEQLGYFLFTKFAAENGWYYPACKPAVYLYPEKDTMVRVQVAIPQGSLTYTDPLYPKGGWTVLAQPSGVLTYLGKELADSTGKINYPTGVFPYLYYEGKIQDSAVAKPEKGFVVAYDTLAPFFDDVLPKLGLTAKEGQEFKDYWLKALPKHSYYFIGVLPQEEVDANEPLTITPKEETMIRVRLYFEGLESPKSVVAPEIMTPKRNGFTVVDWGGMVKTGSNHPFTCLQ